MFAFSGSGLAGLVHRLLRGGGRWKVVFVVLLLLGVFGTAAWVLLGSRLLVVRRVVVAGTRLVPSGQVLGAAGIRLGEPLIRLDAGAIRDRVEAIRQVETARVERSWPTTVRIVVRERTPVVAVPYGGRYLEIDRFGVLVLAAAARPAGLPVLSVTGPGPGSGGQALLAGIAVWRELPAWLAHRVTAMRAAPESVTLKLRTGPSIVWGAPGETADKLTVLGGMLRSPDPTIKTIDVSTPGVVTVS